MFDHFAGLGLKGLKDVCICLMRSASATLRLKSVIFETAINYFSIYVWKDENSDIYHFDICDLLQEKGPSNFVFPTAFRRSQLSLTAFQRFWYINTMLKLWLNNAEIMAIKLQWLYEHIVNTCSLLFEAFSS